MADTKKHVGQVTKSFDAARKALFEIKVATGKGDHAKDVDGLLNEAQKLEAKFDKLSKSLPDGASKHVGEAGKAFDAARKGLMEIKIAAGKGGAAKEIDKVLNDTQKVAADFAKLAKSLD